jgi:hypothetical protein
MDHSRSIFRCGFFLDTYLLGISTFSRPLRITRFLLPKILLCLSLPGMRNRGSERHRGSGRSVVKAPVFNALFGTAEAVP